MAMVERTRRALGSRQGLTTLEQRFRFTGPGATAAAITGVLSTAPLTGDGSIFGDRPGVERPTADARRTLRAFSPAPGFRFDVELARRGDGVFVVRFSQPDRTVPYLQGDLVWTVADHDVGAVLDEQINTQRALEVASEPLHGPRPSLRRWLFFRAGHPQVMRRATNNITTLLHRHAT